MIIKGEFVKSGEEGYALEAFTSDKLEELGYSEVARDTETAERFYQKRGCDDVRLVRAPGSRQYGIIDFGSIVLQKQAFSGQWQEEARLNLEDFVNSPAPFAEVASASSTRVIDFPRL